MQNNQSLVIGALVGLLAVVGGVVAYTTFPAMTKVPAEEQSVAKGEPQPPTTEGRAIFDAIKAAGYPSADKMSSALKTSIIAAVNSGELKTIDQDAPGAGFSAKLVGFSTSDQCADQDVCLVVITNDKGTFVSYVAVSGNEGLEESYSYSLGGFFGGDQYLITQRTEYNIGSSETGYAVDIASGVAVPIAKLVPLVPHPAPIKDPQGNEVDEAAVFEYQNHEIALFIDEVRSQGTRSGPVTSLKFLDENGKLTNLSTLTNIPNPIGDDPVAIDYKRTANSIRPLDETSGEDPLRANMEFNGEGLYMWILGGLYYFDPATGTIGLDLSQSP